ncbi:LPXTG cell wall anchor domain-containing protein [Streptacidiphilus melanogenes]|nr:LPXTG cell wall anchor domain-containing protein [Streptacidiphilus melanogenes]
MAETGGGEEAMIMGAAGVLVTAGGALLYRRTRRGA